jgi:hypothetical protein
MDNTIGEHVAVSRLVSGGGSGRFEDITLPYDNALGPLRQSSNIEAWAISFHWWPAGFSGELAASAGGKVVLMLEGAATVDAGDGESRAFQPGDVLELAPGVGHDHRAVSGDGEPFRAAVIALGAAPGAGSHPLLGPETGQSLPFVRNITGADGRSYFQDGTMPYRDASNGGQVTMPVAISRFQYVYAASDLRYDFHNAPQRQIVLPLTGGTQGDNSGGGNRVIPAGGVYFGEDTTGEGHITSAVNNAIRFSIFAHLA